MIFFVSYLNYCLFLDETLIFEFVLVLFFSVVSVSDFDSVFTTSTSFEWLYLIPSGGIDRLVLF
jgi:hypothetical protein